MKRFVALVITCAASVAYADRQAADRLAAEADAFAAKGDLVAAAAKFRAAYAEDPRTDLMCNVGVAYYKALDLSRAYRYLAQCKAAPAELDPAFVATVSKALAAVEERLASSDFTHVQIVVEPQTATTAIEGSSFDEPFVGTNVAWLPFGHYTLAIHAEGYVDQRIPIDVKTRDPITQHARLVRVNQEPSVPHPPPQPPMAGPTTLVEPSKKNAWIATAATAGLALGAVGGYLVAAHHASQANDYADNASVKPDPEAYKSESHAADTWKYVSWTSAGLAVAGAAVSGYLWYRATRPAHLEVGVSQGGAGVTLSGAW